ncbi:MAG: 3'-5' exonuclease [Chloroflexi bacterium]|nr:3'-5' exonuclease [Chloroflexota bacterium]
MNKTVRETLAAQPLYLDTETTGLGASAEIVEICVLDHDGAVLVDTLVKPTGRIPPDASALHGITDRTVANAPAWPEVWPAVEALLSGRVVAIYNADYDVRLMQQSHRKHRLPWNLTDTRFFCIMKAYAEYHGEWNSRYGSFRWQSLEAAGRQCRINLPGAHRARADALLARAVLHHMAG